MSFESLDLHPNILKAIAARGYTTPTPIQSKAIPGILAGKDIVASAHTGTGKTAAFVLPALNHLCEQPPSKKTRILILTPTRELAAQIMVAAKDYGKFCRFNIINLVGGMPYHQQIKELTRGADIIVATPGRLLDHIEAKRVNLSGVEMLILDEADRMLDMGFIDDVEYIAKLTDQSRQTLLFSATVDKKLSQVVRHLLKDPLRVDLSNEKQVVPKIEQHVYKANNPQHKVRLLNHFLQDKNIFKAIIFTATKVGADRIADKLNDDGFAAAALHGDLRQNVRNRTVEQLRRGKIQFLVATDVAARGIDISDITHVFNYDLPKFCEDYVHRIGRTGRAGKAGVAISFALPTDTRHLQQIERFTGQRLKLISNIDVGQNEHHSHHETPHKTTDSHERPAHKFHRERNESRPFKKRSENDSDRPFTRRGEGSDHPFAKRSESSKDRPFKKRSESDSGRPFQKRGERENNRPFAKRDERDNDRPFAKRGKRDNDHPFAKRSERGNDRPFAKRGERDNDRPSAKRSESGNDRPFKRRNADDSHAPMRTEGPREILTISRTKDGNSSFKKRPAFKSREREESRGRPSTNKDGRRPFKKPFARKGKTQD